MKQTKVRLTKLSSNKNALRTDAVEGTSLRLPRVGMSFFMIAPPLDPAANHREVTTSRIKAVLPDTEKKRFLFETQNSTYLLELI